jgi:hypothetical protein
MVLPLVLALRNLKRNWESQNLSPQGRQEPSFLKTMCSGGTPGASLSGEYYQLSSVQGTPPW